MEQGLRSVRSRSSLCGMEACGQGKDSEKMTKEKIIDIV